MSLYVNLPKSDTILYNSSKCTGCKVCELVCSYVHDRAFNPDQARIHIFNDLFTGKNEADICHHCLSPKCYDACSFNAIYIDENNGTRILDESKCTSCGECVKACPFNESGKIIKFNSSKKTYFKCDFCGGEPMCVEWCGPNALIYRQRKEE